MRELVRRHCAACAEEREFEHPPCVDGHGDDCPELACVACGTAIFAGLLPAAVAAALPASSIPSAA